ncbi:MAG: hypothetical protein HY549_10715 [Elusimicrobia bacterium]|nr:hypothetical protein [Elusimicrobiota bacterium]
MIETKRPVLAVLLTAWCGLNLATTSPQAFAAEVAVGLEAQGIDPWAVLRDFGDIELRDANGRPVSRSLIEAQLREVSLKSLVRNVRGSPLAHAKALARALQWLQNQPFRLQEKPDGWSVGHAVDAALASRVRERTGRVESRLVRQALHSSPGLGRNLFERLAEIARRC